MKIIWKIAIPVTGMALICGAAITWQVNKAKANERKLVDAARVCRQSAEQGDAKAEYDLGEMYYYGRGVTQNYAEAVRWYQKAADQGDASGENGLAYMYSHGEGVPKDNAVALRWYRKAADEGYAKAQFNLGNMYYFGYGVPPENAEAARWYRKAADQGYAKAQHDLGFMYYNGYGVPQDRAEADRWYHKAADQRDKNAQRALGLRGSGLGTWTIISLSGMSFYCLWLLKDSLLPGQSIRIRQQRALIMAELFGLAWVGLMLYGAYGIFPSVLVANIFNFAKNYVIGMTIALLFYGIGPKIAKAVMGISGMLFVGITLLAFAHHDFVHLGTTILAVCPVSGLLIGISVSLAILLWLRNRDSRGELSGHSGGIASETPAES